MESYDSYVDRYKKVGVDISKEPFEIAPGAHTSLGGIVINTDCETNIEGLFAAGEIIGGLHGANRVGGNAGLETLVFGKRAADGMLSYLLGIGENNKNRSDFSAETMQELFAEKSTEIDSEEITKIREKMEHLLQNHLFVIRNGADLKETVTSLEKMKDYVKSHSCQKNPFEKIRLENDLICASLLANAAIIRTESVGCHVRKDSDGGDHHYHVVLKKDINNEMKIWKENV